MLEIATICIPLSILKAPDKKGKHFMKIDGLKQFFFATVMTS